LDRPLNNKSGRETERKEEMKEESDKYEGLTDEEANGIRQKL
jgi:hypothetical protein